MERVVFLVIYMSNCWIQSLPIDNGFTVKIKPLSVKQDLKPQNTGTVFAKAPPDPRLVEDQSMWDVLNRLFFTQSLAANKEQQQNRLEVTPNRSSDYISADLLLNNGQQFLNVPFVSQPYDDYIVVVATAPPSLNIASGSDKKNMAVYVVFPNDGPKGDVNVEDIPRVYFVNEKSVKKNEAKKIEVGPILIIDSNRTVTGLKSKEVPKFVRFKNKLTNRFNYNVTD